MRQLFPNQTKTMCKAVGSALITWAATAAISSAVSVTALSGSNLVTFDSATPGTFGSSVGVNNLTAGDLLVAIDYRPVDGKLIGVGYNSAAGTISVYTLDTASGFATSINSGLNIGTGLSVTADFNPTANAIRVVTSSTTSNNNFRIGAAGTAALTPDSIINPPTSISATAYSFNVAGGGAGGRTTLYEISGSNLVTQGSIDFFGTATPTNVSPNSGTITTVAALSGITGPVVDLDIYSTSASDAGTAYISNGTSFYTLNLATGAATSLGALQGAITDFAVRPIPEPSSLVLLGAAFVGGLSVRRRRNG